MLETKYSEAQLKIDGINPLIIADALGVLPGVGPCLNPLIQSVLSGVWITQMRASWPSPYTGVNIAGAQSDGLLVVSSSGELQPFNVMRANLSVCTSFLDEANLLTFRLAPSVNRDPVDNKFFTPAGMNGFPADEYELRVHADLNVRDSGLIAPTSSDFNFEKNDVQTGNENLGQVTGNSNPQTEVGGAVIQGTTGVTRTYVYAPSNPLTCKRFSLGLTTKDPVDCTDFQDIPLTTPVAQATIVKSMWIDLPTLDPNLVRSAQQDLFLVISSIAWPTLNFGIATQPFRWMTTSPYRSAAGAAAINVGIPASTSIGREYSTVVAPVNENVFLATGATTIGGNGNMTYGIRVTAN